MIKCCKKKERACSARSFFIDSEPVYLVPVTFTASISHLEAVLELTPDERYLKAKRTLELFTDIGAMQVVHAALLAAGRLMATGDQLAALGSPEPV